MARGIRLFLCPAVASVALAVMPSPAHAYIDGGSKACGCAPAGWNVPNGAVISSRGSSGPITGVIDAIGEYYTHSMISHGPGSSAWVSHTTMKTPGVNVSIFGDDQIPVDEIRYGYPGAAQVNMGGAYKMLYGGAVDAVKYTDGGTPGQTMANFLWYTIPSCSSVADGICYYGAYSQQQGDYSYSTEYIYVIGRKYNGTTYRHSYGVYQYADDARVPEGDDMSDPGWAMECSTFAAWSLAVATGQVMTSKFYPNSVIGPAAYTLWADVRDECKSGAGWFGGLFVDCGDIADQMVNCFTSFYACNDDRASTWQTFAATRTATSISPDHVIGVNGHTGTNSPWAGKVQYDVQWNSGGQVCGCGF